MQPFTSPRLGIERFGRGRKGSLPEKAISLADPDLEAAEYMGGDVSPFEDDDEAR